MTVVASTAARGSLYTRAIIAKALARNAHGNSNPATAINLAEQRWGLSVGSQIKSVIDSGDFGSPAATEFFSIAREQSLLGRIPGLRRVPFEVRMLAATSGATGYWVAEGAELPMSALSLYGSSLPRRRVGSLIVQTMEAIRAAGSVAEAGVQRDLLGAVSAAIDAAFISDAAELAGIRPAGICNGVPTTSSTGDLATDVAAMVEAFEGDLLSAVFVCDPATAAGLAGTFEGVGIRGGELLGAPLLTSRGITRDSSGGRLVLLDPSAIAVAFDAGTINPSEHGAVAVTTGQGAAAEVLSLWQANLIGLKCDTNANWKVEVPGSVSVLEVA